MRELQNQKQRQRKRKAFTSLKQAASWRAERDDRKQKVEHADKDTTVMSSGRRIEPEPERKASASLSHGAEADCFKKNSHGEDHGHAHEHDDGGGLT